MIKKKHLFALIALLIVAVNIFVFTKYFSNTYQNKSVFNAISKRTTAFMYTDNISNSALKIAQFEHQNILLQSEFFASFYTQIVRTDSILYILKLETNLNATKTVIAANNVGSNKLDFISLIEYAERFPVQKLKAYLNKHNLELKQYKFQDYTVFTIRSFFDQKEYSFAAHHNILIGSSSAPLVEETLNTLLTKEAKTADSSFKHKELIANNAADFHLFIDHKNKEDLSAVLFTKDFLNTTASSNKMVNWSCYALQVDSNSINYDINYSAAQWSETNFASLLKGKPAGFSFENILPNNTAYFEATSSLDNIGFQNNEVSYPFFKDWLDNEAIFFSLETFDEDFQKRSGLVLKTNNIDTAKAKLKLLNKEMMPILKYEGNSIYEMNVNALSTIFESNTVKLQKPYFTFIDQYVVFANDINVIRTFIQKNKANKTLAKDEHFKQKIDSLSSRVTYFNPQYFASAIPAVIKQNQFPSATGAIFTQYYVRNNNIFGKGTIGFEQIKMSKTQNLWDVVLDTVSNFKPQQVVNADNLRKEIFVQDAKNSIYVISQSGEILLKKEFSETILSDVHQIDLYKANKLFYVFNTQNHIYALKRDGSVVDGYPIKLPTAASNKMLVVNYDNEKKYRFFIACENEKIYGFEANGKPLEAWSPLGAFGLVSTAIKHVAFSQKDYIYFVTNKGMFCAYDRKGEKRFPCLNLETPFVEAFENTAKGFVGFSNGAAYLIDLKGKMSVKNLADTTYKSFTNYLEKDAYAIADANTLKIVKSKWTILGKKAINDNILNIEKLSIKNNTWFLLNASRSIYLINELGEMHPDFPMLASSKALVSKFYDNKNELLLFIEDNKLKAFDLNLPN